jgi:hypothetical protein
MVDESTVGATPRASREPFPGIARRASDELRAIARNVEDLEHAVGEATVGASDAECAQMLELQRLDGIRQRIEGVADFLGALSDEPPHEGGIDARAAAGFVRLAAMAARLGGFAPPADGDGASASAYELFD